jgi:membrane-associated phospholipid phosphatase
VDCILLLGLLIWRFIGEPLAPMTKTFLLAGAVALCMLMVNDLILKVLFGVATPYRYMMEGKAHSFHWLAGSDKSSFPSGHLSMAASFAAVFVRKYPKTIPLFALALAAAAAALIIGDWHFISDVIAGAFVGYVTGTLAAAFWLERLARAQ